MTRRDHLAGMILSGQMAGLQASGRPADPCIVTMLAIKAVEAAAELERALDSPGISNLTTAADILRRANDFLTEIEQRSTYRIQNRKCAIEQAGSRQALVDLGQLIALDLPEVQEAVREQFRTKLRSFKNDA